MLHELVKNFPGLLDLHVIEDEQSAIVKFSTTGAAKVALTGKNTYVLLLATPHSAESLHNRQGWISIKSEFWLSVNGINTLL